MRHRYRGRPMTCTEPMLTLYIITPLVTFQMIKKYMYLPSWPLSNHVRSVNWVTFTQQWLLTSDVNVIRILVTLS